MQTIVHKINVISIYRLQLTGNSSFNVPELIN